ncbi:MAG: FecR domain-containing protein [Flavobacteriales bacterium]|nr:FecR domain-containing protein [Flavobacteriales bacterium]
MNDNTPIPSHLLAAYLAGETDAAQRQAVEDWAAASPENAHELDRMRKLWDLGAEAQAFPEVDLEAAWGKVEERIADAEGRGRVRAIGGGMNWKRWMSAAAVLAGLVFAARWFMQPSSMEHLAQAEAIEVLLGDESRSVLSPSSRMEERMGKQRNISLQGQAYFEVKRDEERPFVVSAGDVSVTVLGTAFEVSAYDSARTVLVRVRSGLVQVEAKGERVLLSAGEHVLFDKERHILERKPAPPAEVWGLRMLHFEGATLAQVVAHLERIYKVRITLSSEGIASCRLTAEFDDEPIEAIMAVIAETFGFEVEHGSDGIYILKGDGC